MPDQPFQSSGALFQSENDGGGVGALCRVDDDRIYVLTRNGMCWCKSGKVWRRIDDGDWDDRDIYGLGVVDDRLALVTERGILDPQGKPIAPAPPSNVETVFGTAHDLWCADDEWQGYHCDGTSWSPVGEAGALGRLMRTSRGDFGISGESRIVRLERGQILPHSARLPEEVMGSWELAVTRDGSIWMNGDDSVFCWDGSAWREHASTVERPYQVVADGNAVVQLGKLGTGARWDGAQMVPFSVEISDDIRSAVVDPFGVILLDCRSHLVELVPRGPTCELHLGSNTNGNRPAWGAATTLIDAIVARLGGSPGYCY